MQTSNFSVSTDTLRDPQQAPVTGYCPRCECEYYRDEIGLCGTCKAELAPYDKRTLDAIFSAFDVAMKPYLSQDLTDTIHNAVAAHFNI